MAAYASLLSLGHILDHFLQHPPRQIDVLDKAQIDSLLENLTFLQDFLEDFSLTRGDVIQALEEKIARSAYAAEDIIEGRVVDQILDGSEAGSEWRNSTLFRQHLQILRNSEAERRSRGIFSRFKLFLKKMNLPYLSRSSTLFSQDLDRKERQLRSKTIPLVLVQWSRHGREESTWELETKMRQEWPHLFENVQNYAMYSEFPMYYQM